MVFITSAVLPLAILFAVVFASAAINCTAEKQAAIADCEDGSGCFIPKCNELEYAAEQCHNSWCFCVLPDGKKLDKYWWKYGTASRNCACARAEAEGEKVFCATNSGLQENNNNNNTNSNKTSAAINCPADQQAVNNECNERGCIHPVCDGLEYAAVQCRHFECFCFLPNGRQLDTYGWKYGSPSSNCDCARAEAGGQTVFCADNGGFPAKYH